MQRQFAVAQGSMNGGFGMISAEIIWLNDWNGALAAARAERKVILIDVMKDP
jgi:hypothetical protein